MVTTYERNTMESDLIKAIREQLAAQFEIKDEGALVRIDMPVTYGDGDGVSVYLSKENPDAMFLTDMGDAAFRNDYGDDKSFARYDLAVRQYEPSALRSEDGVLKYQVKESNIGESAIWFADVMVSIVTMVNYRTSQ